MRPRYCPRVCLGDDDMEIVSLVFSGSTEDIAGNRKLSNQKSRAMVIECDIGLNAWRILRLAFVEAG